MFYNCLNISGTKQAKKALIITFVLSFLYQLNGCFTLLAYITTIFKEAGSTLSPNHSSIVVATVQLSASLLATLLADRLGRKALLGISTAGGAIGLTCTGLYTFYKDDLTSYNWIPIFTFSATILLQTIGVTSMYMVLLNEILPKNVIQLRIFSIDFIRFGLL